MIMRIVVHRERTCADCADCAPNNADESSSRVIESLLSAVTSLTLPVSSIDKLLSILEDEKLYWAIKMGDSACTIAEHEVADSDVERAIDVGNQAATEIRAIRELIDQVTKYKEAAIQAGAH